MGCRICALRDAVEAYRRADGMVVTVSPDPFPMNPRDTDDMNKLISFDAGISGDDVPDGLREAVATAQGVRRLFAGGGVAYPVYAYEHSGYAFALGEMSAGWPDVRWDARRLGWMAAVGESIRSAYGCRRVTEQIRERVKDDMRARLEEYQDYCNGSVYRYAVYDGNWDCRDGCGGFYGFDCAKNGLYESAGLGENPVALKLSRERAAHA